MDSNCTDVLNIGSEEMISINGLVKCIAGLAGKEIQIKNVPSTSIGVMGRNSDNRLIREKLGWAPALPLTFGLSRLYDWIEEQLHGDR
jgi:nucleoside-diphosphate-sugar epimerase